MVDLEKVSLLPRGGFGEEELLPRGLKYCRVESPPSGSKRKGSFDKGGGQKLSSASAASDSVSTFGSLAALPASQADCLFAGIPQMFISKGVPRVSRQEGVLGPGVPYLSTSRK